ncbi:MAG: DEAD/DEAH box helicase family protein, partial [Chloroflexales bacterium]|nr:DEAD/DEAH box helicase family protein [Chloroflexales bacterium]
MIDFSKKVASGKIEKKKDPLEIYENLDRRSETGPLRPSQIQILESWFKTYQNKKNTIIKLHTGEGKTLIGLLLLLSKMNQDKGPSMYLCPNKYLVEQTCLEAEKFGIPYCTMSGSDIPEEFLTSQKILVTHIQKVFNGLSVFGIKSKSIKVGSVILDDSHACIDSIRSSFTIKINKDEPLFSEIVSLFEDDLREQGEGTFLDIINNDYSSLLAIPYWSWIDKTSEIITLLSKCTD